MTGSAFTEQERIRLLAVARIRGVMPPPHLSHPVGGVGAGIQEQELLFLKRLLFAEEF